MTAASTDQHSPSSPAPQGPILYRNGSVYTTVDPGASAMIVEGDQVVWVGAEQAADSLLDARMTVVDLDGRLVSPAFVDSSADLLRLGSPARATALGLGALVHTGPVTGHEQQLLERVEAGRTGAGPRVLLWPTLEVLDDAEPAAAEELSRSAQSLREVFDARTVVGLRLIVTPGQAGRVATFVSAVVRAGLRPALAVATRQQLPAVLEGLDTAARQLGERTLSGAGVRVDLIGAGEDAAVLGNEDIARLAAASVTVCLDPSSGAPIAEFYRQGVPVTWGTGGELLDGWGAVRSLVHHRDPEQRISARAAFVAATRGAWRALGGAHPLAGQLATGTPATFAVWEVEALMVQQAEGTAASWSTDPRARTPLLPALEEEAAPVCTETTVDGHRLPLT